MSQFPFSDVPSAIEYILSSGEETGAEAENRSVIVIESGLFTDEQLDEIYDSL